MRDVTITSDMLQEVQIEVPETLEGALDKEWLSAALAHICGGAKIANIDLTDVFTTMAAKVRVAVTFEGRPDDIYRLCIKGFFDSDIDPAAGGLTTLRESDFYLKVAPRITMRTPSCVSLASDRTSVRGVLIMADMIAAGSHFYNATEPFTADQAAESLDQLARLHAHPELLVGKEWITCRIQEIADHPYFSWSLVQQLMHDERRADLPSRTLDASLLEKGLQAMAQWTARQPQTILHGDVHPGNVYRTAEGKLGFTDWQCICRGHWAQDVAYHIISVLPVGVAEREERNLLNHYLDALSSHGGEKIDRDLGWENYRKGVLYGYYYWSITQRVDPAITHEAFYRLGSAVTRLDSYTLFGL